MSSLHNYYPFDYPSSRMRPERAEAIGVYANNWINDVLPYRNNGVYRVHEAMYSGGGNCYAQALGTMALLSSWGVSNGLVIDRYHAKVVMMHDDDIWFIDPTDANFTPGGEARVKRHDDTGVLARHYEDTVEDVLSGDQTPRYYYIEPMVHARRWLTVEQPDFTIPSSRAMNAHVIISHKNAEDAIHATGDLKRYQKQDPLSYEHCYDELIGDVPRFFDLPAPIGKVIEKAHV